MMMINNQKLNYLFIIILVLFITDNSRIIKGQQLQYAQQPGQFVPPNPELEKNLLDERVGSAGVGGPGSLTVTVMQFLKSTQATSRFAQLIEQIAQQSVDRIVIDALSGNQMANSPLANNMGYTVFVPVNDALNEMPTDPNELRNEIYNLIVRDRITLDQMAQMEGQNVTRTFGYRPRLHLRTVKNFYSRLINNNINTGGNLNNNINNRGGGGGGNQYRRPPNNQFQNNPNQRTGKNPMRQQLNNQNKLQQKQLPNIRDQMMNSAGRQVRITTINETSIEKRQLPNQPPYFGQGPNEQQSPPPIPGPRSNDNRLNENQVLPGASQPGNPFPTNNQNFPPQQQQGFINTDSNIYDMHMSQFPNDKQPPYNGPPISSNMPQDRMYLINGAIILDRFEVNNGIVYMIDTYPRFYEASVYNLLERETINGLSSNLKEWVRKAKESYNNDDENLQNALNAYGPNTYFLPIDSAFRAFSAKEYLENSTILFDIIFRSHRVTGQLLFDYYLDDAKRTYYTDTDLPVSTKHQRINGREDIEISIGHVKGKILPDFRNIYCGSGVLHLVDTVMGIPGRSAYQELLVNPDLSVFRSIVDMSTRFRQLLDQTPSQMLNPNNNQYNNNIRTQQKQRLMRQKSLRTVAAVASSPFTTPMTPIKEKRQAIEPGPANGIYNNQQQRQPQYPQQQHINSVGSNQINSNIQFVTVLAPSNLALATVPIDQLMGNMSAIDDLLSSHIIVDNSGGNRVYYTDHDQSVFTNTDYPTLNPMVMLRAQVMMENPPTSNRVTFTSSRDTSLRTTIINGNSRVSNGVIHIVNKALIRGGDIAQFLQQYSQGTGGSPAFNQFVDALASTGILRDLTQPNQQYTLFIPTNEALARYNDIMIGNNEERKKQLIYRHLCMNTNLQSTNLDTMPMRGNNQMINNQQRPPQGPQQQQQQQTGFYNTQNALNNGGANVQPQPNGQQLGQPGQYNPGVPPPPPRNKRQTNSLLEQQQKQQQLLRQQELLRQQQQQQQQQQGHLQGRQGQQHGMLGQNQNNLMMNQQQHMGPNHRANNGPQLVCRNALGQELALMKDNSNELVGSYHGASSKILSDIQGSRSSAYILEEPLLSRDPNVPNYGLGSYNSATSIFINRFLIGLIFIIIINIILF